jgi:hypothetical protein
MSKVTISRTLLAPSQEQGRVWAARAWSLLAEHGEAARPQLEKEFGENVNLYFSEIPRFRHEDFFSTGGHQVEIGHPNLPRPIGACAEGLKSAWYCGRDAHFEIEGHKLCRKHFNRHLENLYRGLELWSNLGAYYECDRPKLRTAEKLQRIKEIKAILSQFPEYASRPLVVEEWESLPIPLETQKIQEAQESARTYSRVYRPRQGRNARRR